MTKLFASLAALTILLGASAGAAAPYQPAQRAGDDGYSEERIEPGQYSVWFRGEVSEQTHSHALLRAAELTLSDGYDWFRVTKEELIVDDGGRCCGRPSETAAISILMGKGPKPDSPDTYDAGNVRATMGPRT